MTFDASRGTRGGRQPNSGFMRAVNSLVALRVRRKSGGTMMGLRLLVLTTTGRKSGTPRSVPVGWFPDGAGNWLVVASANGAVDNPAWYYNLAANPNATIHVDGQTIPVTASQLHGEEREQAWRTVVSAAPRFGQYAARTDRQIPIVRLSRAS